MSESSWPYGFAWTPPQAGYLGAVILRQWPAERLTAPTYWNLLGERINRLIAATGAAGLDAWELLEPVRRNEPSLTIDRSMVQAGTLLAEGSEWLHDRVHFPHDGVLIGELTHQPETYELLIDDWLEEYIGCLYSESE